ncbi:MAG: hypothetical protein ABR538_12365 [Candidatus Binatia bacterium]
MEIALPSGLPHSVVEAAQARFKELAERLAVLRAEAEIIKRELGPLEDLLKVWGESKKGAPAPATPAPWETGAATESDPGLPPLPRAIEQILKEAGHALNHEDLRRDLLAMGFSKENLGVNAAYYYKTVGRLKKAGRIKAAGTGLTA